MCPQHWEEDEAMTEDNQEESEDEDPGSRTESKANGEEDMEHENESEEEWEHKHQSNIKRTWKSCIYFHFIFMHLILLLE